MTISAGSLASAADVNAALATKVNDTGDTITGTLNLTGAGTGLAVTNNATVGGSATVTGGATLGSTTSGANVLAVLNGATSGARKIQWQTAGVGRFDMGLSNSGEGGSNAGSDWSISRRNDAGTVIDTPVTLKRSTGLFTYTGSIFQNPATITLSDAITAAQEPFSSFVTYNGTPGVDGTYGYHWFIINDSVQHTAPSNALGGYYQLKLNTGWTGSRVGLGSSVNLIGQGGTTAGSVLSLWGDVTGTANQGGTALTTAGAFGSIWAGLLNATLASTATNYALFQGLEIDLNAVGTSIRKHGLQISLGPADLNRGTLFDGAIMLGNSTSSAGSWKHGLILGTDSAQWPFASDSSLITAKMGQNDVTKPAVAALGVDFVDVNFGTAAFRTNGFLVDGSGTAQIGTGRIQALTSGLSIDAVGAVGNTADGGGMIATGGTGQNNGAILTDPYGGRYNVAANSSGVATSLVVYRQPTLPTTTTPSNPVTLAVRSGGTGTPPTINISWNTTASTLSLNPSGGPIKSALLTNAVNDAAAATAGVVVGQFYRNGSIVMQRVS